MVLGRIVPLLMLAGAAKEGMEKMQPVVDYTTQVAVQAEMNTLSRMILLDHTVDGETPSPEQFPDWVRKSMQTKGDRDPAKDMWGQDYRIEYENGGIVIIRSAGKDKQYKTDDDLKAQVRLQ